MDPPQRPTANEVGDAFVTQYYHVLQNCPEHLHRVYKENSRIGRPGDDGRMRSSTLEDIDENLNILSSGGFDSVEVTTVISQDSIDGSVSVTVGGYFTLNKRLGRNFTQVFFLAPQENGYFVLNDMFRFDDGQPFAPDENVIEDNVPETEVTHREVADYGSNIADASVAIPEDQGHHSFLDDAEDENNQESQWLHKSSEVYVKNLPPNNTFSWIENAFTKFGQIKKVEIKKHDMGHHYGFVEFKDANAANRAIQASPLRIAGRKVVVRRKLAKGYWELKKNHEEERRQHSQNRYRSEHLRGTRVFDFWEWVESMGERSIRQEEERGTRDYDFWEWRRSMEEHSRLREEQGGPVDHSWDYEQVMEEHRKFQEEQRKLEEEEEEEEEE